MVNIRDVPGFVWAVVLSAIFAGVGALVLAEFRTTLTTGTQTDIIDNGTEGIANIMEQFPTVGTIVGVSVIVGVVVLLFVAFRSRDTF
jgi:ABC-type transport system involved in Fe-S cluster assembly fused permease/ATPase subunit